ncbi:hypothetical protein V8G54_024167 [Vigna mungo]|uniref:C-JID domain-containing protein n=1 Tax=Vigna mungo TaxID=3915 RepID=A0AAQ3RT79_VIGMU
MDKTQSLQLLRKKAFRSNDIGKEHERLTLDILKYVKGLPLAIEVLGSFLLDRDVCEWRTALMLRISYDGLENIKKEIFLDIACLCSNYNFYSWEPTVKKLLDYRQFYPDIGMKEAENVEAIFIEQPQKEFLQGRIRVDALSKMDHLEILILRNVNCYGTLNFISNELRYLFWNHFPWLSLPFFPDQLVELILHHSNIKLLWEGKKCPPNLRNLDMSHSKNLIEVPDLSEVPRLTDLNLEGCIQLVHIHPSIGIMRDLRRLNLKSCKNLIEVLDLSEIFPTTKYGSGGTAVGSASDDYRGSATGLGCMAGVLSALRIAVMANRRWICVWVGCMADVLSALRIAVTVYLVPRMEIVIPGSEIPKWFSKQKASTSISMDPSAVIDDPNWIGVSICVLFVTHEGPMNLGERDYLTDATLVYGVNNVINFGPKRYSGVSIKFKKDLVTVGLDYLLIVFYSRQEFIHLLNRHSDTMHDRSPPGLRFMVKNCGYRWLSLPFGFNFEFEASGVRLAKLGDIPMRQLQPSLCPGSALSNFCPAAWFSI